MKRIFSIFLCALMVCTILIVPFSAFAEEEDSAIGTWLLNETLTNHGTIYMDFTYSNGTTEYTATSIYFEFISAYNNLVVKYGSTNVYSSATYGGWASESYRTIKVTSEPNANGLAWLKANGTKQPDPTCDGTTCPATDINIDNICDDCGLTFSMLREFTPNDFPSGYPAVPSVASDARYYLYTVQSTGRTYIVVYPDTVTPTYDTTKQNGYLYFSECYGYYELDTVNNEWKFVHDDSPYFIGGTNKNSVDIHYSSVQIKDQNGENFFPIPLWEKVEQVTQGEIPLFSQTLGGNLMTLTLCGVGCLTLLVALVLLYKTLRTSLPR